MAEQNLKGMKIAILVTDGFEQVELTEPRKALDKAGADTKVVSPREMRVRGWKFTDWGDELPVDVRLNQARPEDFDALHLPGGVINPIRCVSSRRRSPSQRRFSTPASRWHQSAMDPGWLSRPAVREGVA